MNVRFTAEAQLMQFLRELAGLYQGKMAPVPPLVVVLVGDGKSVRLKSKV